MSEAEITIEFLAYHAMASEAEARGRRPITFEEFLISRRGRDFAVGSERLERLDPTLYSAGNDLRCAYQAMLAQGQNSLRVQDVLLGFWAQGGEGNGALQVS